MRPALLHICRICNPPLEMKTHLYYSRIIFAKQDWHVTQKTFMESHVINVSVERMYQEFSTRSIFSVQCDRLSIMLTVTVYLIAVSSRNREWSWRIICKSWFLLHQTGAKLRSYYQEHSVYAKPSLSYLLIYRSVTSTVLSYRSAYFIIIIILLPTHSGIAARGFTVHRKASNQNYDSYCILVKYSRNSRYHLFVSVNLIQ